jgi:hypothetical protein
MQASKWAHLHDAPKNSPVDSRPQSKALAPSSQPAPTAASALLASSTHGATVPFSMLHNRPTLPVTSSKPTSSNTATSVYSPQDARSGTHRLPPRATPFMTRTDFASPALVKHNASNIIFAGSKPVGRPSRAIATAPSVVIAPSAQQQTSQVQQSRSTALSLSTESTLSARHVCEVTLGTSAKTPERITSTNSIQRFPTEMVSDCPKFAAPAALARASLKSNEVMAPRSSTRGKSTPAGHATSTSSTKMTVESTGPKASPQGDVSKGSQKKTESLGVQQFAAWPKREKRLDRM